jgi:predicted membrane-bound mannosyltransferase
MGMALDAAAGEEAGAGVAGLGVDEFTPKVPLGSPFLFKLLFRSDWSWRYACCPYGTCTAVSTLTEVDKSDRRAIILNEIVEISTMFRTSTSVESTPAVAATLAMYWASTARNAVLVMGKITTRTTRTVSDLQDSASQGAQAEEPAGKGDTGRSR